MLVNYLRHAALAATFITVVNAQASVPKDLSAGFGASGTEIQVSYTNNAVDGFADGKKFTKDEVAKEPTFALGDSSGIVPKARYTIILIDNTDNNARTLHYARTNFALTGDIVNIASETTPVLAYQAPGAFGETGERKYSFLLYQHFANKEVDTLKVPEEGKAFEVSGFQTDNGFEDPVGGLGMVVDLGTSGGNTAGTTTAAQQASTTASQKQASTTTAEETLIDLSTALLASSASVRVSSIVSRISSAVISSATDDSQPSETTEAISQTAAQTSDLAAASSVLAGPSTSTIFLAPNSTGTATGTGGAAQATGSGASGMALGTATCVVGAAMMVFAGLLAW